MKRLVVLLLLVGCGDLEEADVVSRSGPLLTGTWSATMSFHDAVPCAGELMITESDSKIAGTWSCLDMQPTPAGKTFPASQPGYVWASYGTVTGTVGGSSTIEIRGWPQGTHPAPLIFSEAVTTTDTAITGTILRATKR